MALPYHYRQKIQSYKKSHPNHETTKSHTKERRWQKSVPISLKTLKIENDNKFEQITTNISESLSKHIGQKDNCNKPLTPNLINNPCDAMIGCNWWTSAAQPVIPSKQIVEISYVNDVRINRSLKSVTRPNIRSPRGEKYSARNICPPQLLRPFVVITVIILKDIIPCSRKGDLLSGNLVRKQYKHQFSTIKLLLLNSWLKWKGRRKGDLSKTLKCEKK